MEAITYTEDVEPYSFTQIYAGVGSGKNYFAEELMKGYDEELKDGTVICHNITARNNIISHVDLRNGDCGKHKTKLLTS